MAYLLYMSKRMTDAEIRATVEKMRMADTEKSVLLKQALAGRQEALFVVRFYSNRQQATR